MSAEFRLGIQSFCFRKFKPLSSLIDCLKQVGLKYVEVWPGHLDFKAGEEVLRAGLAELKAAGVKIDGYGAIKVPNDEDVIRRYLGFCRLAGVAAGTVVDIEEAAVGLLQRLCEEYDVNVAVHNHGRKWQYGSYDSIRKLLDRTSRRIGVCLDAAWALDSKEDPVAGVDIFADRLYGVHLKDFVFDAEGNHRDVLIGRGGLDLPAFMRRLKDMGFRGYLSLEYEGNADDPMAEVKQCVEIVQDAIKSLGR